MPHLPNRNRFGERRIVESTRRGYKHGSDQRVPLELGARPVERKLFVPRLGGGAVHVCKGFRQLTAHPCPGGSTNRVEVIEVELSLVPLYDGQDLAPTVCQMLRSEGFVPLALDVAFTDPTTGEILCLDGLFASDHRLD